MKIGKFEIIYHKSEIPTDFKTECGLWYYLPIKWSVTHYLRQGRKLQAVKLHYYRTNKKGLKESKIWVDTLQIKRKITI